MLPESRGVQRHDLVWLNASGWRAVAAQSQEQIVLLQQWQQQDWPLIGRRRDADAAEDECCLGIATPPDAQGVKGRLALRVPVSGVRESRAPLDIEDVLTTVKQARPSWYEALEQLQQELLTLDLSFRVFGSLALQSITGQSYLRERSDIDLLFAPMDRDELTQGTRLLTHYAGRLPLDGEIRFPDGCAVAWKEWQQACSASEISTASDANPDRKNIQRVLVKRDHDVALLRVDSLLKTLEAPALCQY